MNKTERRNAMGVSLPELLVGMAVASIVATGIVVGLSRLSNTVFRLKTFHEHAYGLGSVLTLLKEGMIHYDAHTLPLPPRIHRQTIRFYPPSADYLTLHNRDETSHAITFFEVVPMSDFLIKKWHSPHSIETCSTSYFSWQFIRSAIAISADSFAEIKVLQSSQTLQNCHIINFTIPERSLIAPQKMRTPPTKIIPLKRTYTLYRATSGALRYISHVGAETIENQPVTHRSPNLELQLQNLEAEGIYDLQINYKISQRRLSNTIHILTHVPRLSLSNNALNGF